MVKNTKIWKVILRIICILLVIVGVITIYTLIKSNTPENHEVWMAPEEMANATTFHDTSIEIQEGTLTNTSATFIIKKPQVEDEGFIGVQDEYYRLFKKVFGKWRELTPLDLYKTSDLPGVIRPDSYIYNCDINWKEDYGYLNKGVYKLSIPVIYTYFDGSTYETEPGYIGVEFEIK